MSIKAQGLTYNNLSMNEERHIATAICQIIAMKLVNDEHFQSEIMAVLEGEESEPEDSEDAGL